MNATPVEQLIRGSRRRDRHQIPPERKAWSARAIGFALAGLLLAARPAPGCTGDCDANDEVTINELITGVSIALGSRDLASCPAFDRDGSGTVTVNELIAAVGQALGGCPPTRTPTTTPTGTPTGTATATPTKTANMPPVIAASGVYRTFPFFEIARPIGATDPEGAALDYDSAALPPGATLEDDGILRWVPAPDQIGPWLVPFTVSDSATPPASAQGQLIFQVDPLDPCMVPSCDPATGCTATLRPITENCCEGEPVPRVEQATAPCPAGLALFIGRNFRTFGRMQNCDQLRAALGLQTGPEVRVNVAARCINPIQVSIQVRLATRTHVLFDQFQTAELLFREDGSGYVENIGLRFPVDLAVPHSSIQGVCEENRCVNAPEPGKACDSDQDCGAEAELTVTVTDLDGITLSKSLRVVLTFDRLNELPNIP